MHEVISEIQYADMLSSLQPGSFLEQPAKNKFEVCVAQTISFLHHQMAN
jgi:hypothetical protein